MPTLKCFKAYDVRGRLGEDFDEDVTWRIGRAFGQHFSARRVAVGGDARLSSPGLKAALSDGLMASGADVWDLGLAGTEEIYFAALSQDIDGAIEVTGSHNPLTDNGLKFIGRGAVPLDSDADLASIRSLAEAGRFGNSATRGQLKTVSLKEQYVEHILKSIDLRNMPNLKVLVNPGHGAAGPVIDLIEHSLAKSGVSLDFAKVGFNPDGSFPLGLPNPLIPENRHYTAEAVRSSKASLGLAWDGDFDRCFFFDEHGEFVEGYYMVGLLAEAFLGKSPGATVIHDPRLVWNTIEVVNSLGGRPVVSKTGHAFIKQKMRAENAIYGGEMSAHHYFANFAFCDSGMIPWLLVLDLMGRKNASLSTLISERQAKYPCSGEINYRVAAPLAVLSAVEARWGREALRKEAIDGLSMEMPQWRFNLRTSNTEPLLRLNLETRGNADLVNEKISDIEKIVLKFVNN